VKLGKLHAKDFCQFKSILIDFSTLGLTWLGGRNYDSDAARSNGSGKSNFFKAITWLFYGECLDGHSGDALLRFGTKHAEVRADVHEGDQMWVVSRERRKGSTTLTITEPSGAEVEGSVSEKQRYIDNLLGADWITFQATSIYTGSSSRKCPRFAHHQTTNTERSAILHSICRTEILVDGAYPWAKKKLREYEAAFDKTEQLLRSAEEQRITCLEEIEGCNRRLEIFDERQRERVSEIRGMVRDRVSKAKRALGEARSGDQVRAELEAIQLPDRAELTNEVSRTQQELEGVKQAELEAMQDVVIATAAADTTRDRLRDINGEKCPVCTGSLQDGAAAEFVGSLRTRLVAERVALDAKTKNYSNAKTYSAIGQGQVTRAHQAVGAADELSAQASVLAEKFARYSQARERAKEYAAEAEEFRGMSEEMMAEENPSVEALEVQQKRLEDLEKAIADFEINSEALLDKVAVAKWWVTGFSAKGLPAKMLDSVMPILTEKTNDKLRILSGGDIVVEFQSQSQIKTGEFREKILILETIEGRIGYPASDGQAQKIQLSTDLALLQLARLNARAKLDILLLDEAIDGLDSEGRERVLAVVRQLRNEISTILVVSHDADAAESFEQAILVRKRDGIATVQVT